MHYWKAAFQVVKMWTMLQNRYVCKFKRCAFWNALLQSLLDYTKSDRNKFVYCFSWIFCFGFVFPGWDKFIQIEITWVVKIFISFVVSVCAFIYVFWEKEWKGKKHLYTCTWINVEQWPRWQSFKLRFLKLLEVYLARMLKPVISSHWLQWQQN